MKTILFNGHDLKFLTHVTDYFKNKQDRYRVLIDEFPGHEISDKVKSAKLLKEADLIFCEWALGNAVWYSKHKKPHQRLVIRLHHQEIGLKYIKCINYANVDRIIFICQENRDIFLSRFPHLANIVSLIYNVIDFRCLDQPKLPQAEFNLGFIGMSPMRKAPHHTIDLFRHLRNHDSRYALFFKGKHPWEYPWLWARTEERIYYQHLYRELAEYAFSNSITFDPHGNDMPEWFQKIGFIMSTSDHEGSHQAVAEGMASGSIPLIRNWDGADKIYPREFVVNSLQEAIELINKFRKVEIYEEKVRFVKEYARNNFDIPVITSKYDELFSNLLGQGFTVTKNSVKVIMSPTQNIRIMFVCYLKPGSQSGYEVRVIEEAKILTRQGVNVFIAVFVGAEFANSKDLLSNYEQQMNEITGATIFAIPTRHFFDLSVTEGMKEEIDKPLLRLTRENQITIMHGQALYSTMHALRAGKQADIKIVFDVHGISPEETEMTGGDSKRVQMMTSMEKEALLKADLKILVSERMRQFFIEKYNIKAEPFQLIPCCVQNELFAMSLSERNLIRKKKGFEGKFVLLYLGTLSAWQWPEAMFNLFSQFHKAFPESVFYLLIPEYDQPKANLFINHYRIPQEGYLMEEVPHADVGKIIGAADAGVLLRENNPVNLVSSPTKFGEYLAAGLPVILTEGIGDYTGFVREHGVGISIEIDDDDFPSEELNKLVSFATHVHQNRKHWAELCAVKANEHLSWAVYGKRLAENYSHLLTD